MDFAETMKNVLIKGLQQNEMPAGSGIGFPGYVTEKLYMLLQLYLQNKSWNPSMELLQCFNELKESSVLPSAAYLQMMASRVTLDSQGRLILRENGKIVLPFEHFANAVMLKHMNGPHGLHLGVEATVRAVVESYTIGRENFGMEKEFIVEVVQNCPNPACRYYKNQIELTQKTLQHLAPSYMTDRPPSADVRNHLANQVAGLDPKQPNPQLMERPKSVAPPTQQEIAAALIQQQSRVLAQQNLDKLNANLEKQRHQQQLQLQHQQHQQPPPPPPPPQQQQQPPPKQQHFELPLMDHKLTDFLRANLENFEGFGAANKDLLALHNGAWASPNAGAASGDEKRITEGGQEKIVRAFGEVMKNMQRMKTYVRPAMCKPYGKQSEALQKTLMDTIQLIQSLRSFLPPPHIQVSSWKNEDKHRYEEN
ncbi:uncharacterized protein LOC132707732 [Cylas formicarius]|uniref:uncharacterized protein LOC132707732 n=1 Tax=Cylas formicarius TaxID=197179 RepID=UPI002958CE6C|nr:uncharacterized protein LOC132707732 [Cylas formicarius]